MLREELPHPVPPRSGDKRRASNLQLRGDLRGLQEAQGGRARDRPPPLQGPDPGGRDVGGGEDGAVHPVYVRAHERSEAAHVRQRGPQFSGHAAAGADERDVEEGGAEQANFDAGVGRFGGWKRGER